MRKILVTLGTTATGLLLANPVFAVDPTPTVTVVPATANQVFVNIAQSIVTAITDLIPLAVQYGLPLFLIFLVIGVGVGLFNRFRHG